MFTIIILIEINKGDYYDGMVFAFGRLPHCEKTWQER
jgi:hypothetical protein